MPRPKTAPTPKEQIDRTVRELQTIVKRTTLQVAQELNFGLPGTARQLQDLLKNAVRVQRSAEEIQTAYIAAVPPPKQDSTDTPATKGG